MDQYQKKVEDDFARHDNLVKKNHERNTKLLDSQANTVIEDANNDKKWAAVNNMRLTYERELKEQLEE